jgi:hypothetical protein
MCWSTFVKPRGSLKSFTRSPSSTPRWLHLFKQKTGVFASRALPWNVVSGVKMGSKRGSSRLLPDNDRPYAATRNISGKFIVTEHSVLTAEGDAGIGISYRFPLRPFIWRLEPGLCICGVSMFAVTVQEV